MDWKSLRQRIQHMVQQGSALLGRVEWRSLHQRLLHELPQVSIHLRSLGQTLWRGLREWGHWLVRAHWLAEAWAPLRQRLPQDFPAWWAGPDVPPSARRLVDGWHRGECWLAVACFGFIAGILILDVLGREFLGPFLRLIGLDPGATGIFASQKLSIFALVIGSFAGIGIATATGAHIVPGFAAGWVPAEWKRAFDRAADLLTGLFLIGVTWFGLKFVGSSLKTDLRAPVLDWPVWPIQLAIPLGFLSAAGRYFVYAAWPTLKPEPPEFQE
jgi:TRAP-type C4-dicarboxylate transport system permease small subunit